MSTTKKVKSRLKAAFYGCGIYTRDLLARQKFRKTRRKGTRALKAYMRTSKWACAPTTTYCGIYAREGSVNQKRVPSPSTLSTP